MKLRKTVMLPEYEKKKSRVRCSNLKSHLIQLYTRLNLLYLVSHDGFKRSDLLSAKSMIASTPAELEILVPRYDQARTETSETQKGQEVVMVVGVGLVSLVTVATD